MSEDEQAPDELREAAGSVGVTDTGGKDPDELVDAARSSQSDSASSPTNPELDAEHPEEGG